MSFIRSSSRLLSLTAPLILAGWCAAQDAATPASSPLLEACAKMKALPSMTFKTFEEQDAAMTRRFAKMMPASARETEVRGQRVGDLLGAQIADDAQELVFAKGRMIARETGGLWSPRRGVDMFGAGLPFVFDPSAFFDRLAEVGESGTDLRSEDAQWREKNVRIVTASFTGDAARDLVLGGAVPSPRGMGGMIMLGGGHIGNADLPEYTLDLALWIDPETGLCQRIRANAYQESDVPGNVQFQVQGADEPEEEPEEKVTEFDADGNRIYKNGLPLRGVDASTSAVHFEVTLGKHGTAEAPKLDDRARKLLGLSAAGTR